MPSKKTNGRKRVRSPKPIPKSTSDPAPERYSRDQILDLLEDHFETVTEAYRKTQAYTELKTFFTELLTKDDKLEIDRCICVGLGSLAIGWIDIDECEYAPTECTSHGRPMSQFVAFNEWVRHISSLNLLNSYLFLISSVNVD